MQEKDLINQTVQEELLKWDGDELLAELERRGIPSAPVNTFDRTLSDPHTLARNMVVEATHPSHRTFKMPGNPVKLSGTPGETFDPPPLLGQHNREVYQDLLGLAEDELEALGEKGVV